MATTNPKTQQSPSSNNLDRTREYAEAVVSGIIKAGPHVRNACKRHLKDLEDGHLRGLHFDQAAAEYAFNFFESCLFLSEGQFEGVPFRLHPSQAFIIGCLFGWKKGEVRRYRRAYIEQGKGNGKSPMAGGLGLLGLCADGESGSQVYSAAAKKEQAGILFQDACKMVRASPVLMKRLDFSGGQGREFNIAFHKKGSFFRPVSRDTGKTGSGPRPYFVLVDEVHELPDRKVIEILERGFKFRRQPMLFMITNSGSDRNSVAWEERTHAVNCAAGHTEAVNDPKFVGGVIDDSTFSYVCALDDGDEPLTDPSCWVKANPLLGVTITEEYLQGVVDQARQIPGKLNGILRLHFCVWTDAETAWMTRETLEPLLADFDPEIHKGKEIFGGLDLSQSRDITATGWVCRTGETKEGKPTFDIWADCFTPGDTVQARELRDKLPYSVWIEQGWLNAPQGQNINYTHVAQLIAEYSQNYLIKVIAYDRFAFKRFEEETDKIGLTVEFLEHPQGGTKKGKASQRQIDEADRTKQPRPEGLWMPGSLRLLEDAMLEGRVRIQKNPVLISAIMSAVLEEDRWGNSWLAKTRSLNKIDPAVAVCMAMGAASTSAGKKKLVLAVVK